MLRQLLGKKSGKPKWRIAVPAFSESQGLLLILPVLDFTGELLPKGSDKYWRRVPALANYPCDVPQSVRFSLILAMLFDISDLRRIQSASYACEERTAERALSCDKSRQEKDDPV